MFESSVNQLYIEPKYTSLFHIDFRLQAAIFNSYFTLTSDSNRTSTALPREHCYSR